METGERYADSRKEHSILNAVTASRFTALVDATSLDSAPIDKDKHLSGCSPFAAS